MPKIVYVPQGRVARLHAGTLPYDINGLYTDHFSTCNILIVKNKKCVELAHIDALVTVAPQQMESKIQGLKDADEIILISREKEGKLLQGHLLQYFNDRHSDKKITIREIDLQHDGILVSVQRNSKNELETKIKIYPIGNRPEDLIHHPYEQQLQGIRKIKQIIGLRAINTSRSFVSTFYPIFEGRAWDYVEPRELVLEEKDPITKSEINSFNKTDSYMVIASKLNKILEISEKEGLQKGVPMKDLILPVAINLESYLNDYDLDRIFKRNIIEMLTNEYNLTDYCSISTQDKKFKEDTLKILNKADNVFREFQDIVEEYKQNASSTKFKDLVLDEIRTFSRHYNERKIYNDLAAHRKNEIGKAIKINEQAVKLYQNKNYQGAINLFTETLKLFAYYCIQSDLLLVKAYYNLGKTLFMAEQYIEAKFFIEIALTLRQEFFPNEKADLEKVAKALQDCEAKLKQENIEEKISILKM